MDSKQKLPWRDYLTDAERQILDESDRAKSAWLAMNDRRAGIVNRAIQRAKYALLSARQEKA